MAEGIGRLYTMGIAKETTYGTAATTPTFTLPLLERPEIIPVQNKEENTAALGSTYAINDAKNTTRMAKVSLKVKIDEDHLPLFLLNKFTISTVTVSGDSAVYRHTLSHSSTNTGTVSATSFTLFLQDPVRNNATVKAAGFVWNSMNLILDKGFFRMDLEGMGKFPATWTGTNSVVQPKEFVGRNASLAYGDSGSSTTATTVLSMNLNHAFNLSDDDTNFVLGTGDVSQIYPTEDRFELEVVKKHSDFNMRDDWTNNTRKQLVVTVQDTDRYVSTSVVNTNPKVTLTYPVAKIIEWALDGGNPDITKENVKFLVLDEVGTSNTPAVIEVINKIAAY